jgi:hypothetical protein
VINRLIKAKFPKAKGSKKSKEKGSGSGKKNKKRKSSFIGKVETMLKRKKQEKIAFEIF